MVTAKTFFCPGCSRHRPLDRRGTHKAGNHFRCLDCEARSVAVHVPKKYRSRSAKFFSELAR